MTESKFLTRQEASQFFDFLKRKLRISKASYARALNMHPVSINQQCRVGKVRRDQVQRFMAEFLLPLSFLVEDD